MKKKLLEKLIAIPSPSGSEHVLQKAWKKSMEKYADDFVTDGSGNIAAVLNPNGKPKITISAHCDEIHLCVRGIDEHGFIFLDDSFSYDLSIVPAKPVFIHTKNGRIPGVIGHPPIHLLGNEIPAEDKESLRAHNIWIDIGTKNKEEVEKMGVKNGDAVTFDSGYYELANKRIAARGMDNKIGVFAVSEMLRELAKEKKGLKAAVYVVLSVREESSEIMPVATMVRKINPEIALVVDVTNAIDNPMSDTAIWERLGSIFLDKGPVIGRGPEINDKLFDFLESAAIKKKIPHQIESIFGVMTEASFVNIVGHGIPTGLVSIPLRYMHTPVETVSLQDVKLTIKLLKNSVLNLRKDTDFKIII